MNEGRDKAIRFLEDAMDNMEDGVSDSDDVAKAVHAILDQAAAERMAKRVAGIVDAPTDRRSPMFVPGLDHSEPSTRPLLAMIAEAVGAPPNQIHATVCDLIKDRDHLRVQAQSHHGIVEKLHEQANEFAEEIKAIRAALGATIEENTLDAAKRAARERERWTTLTDLRDIIGATVQESTLEAVQRVVAERDRLSREYVDARTDGANNVATTFLVEEIWRLRQSLAESSRDRDKLRDDLEAVRKENADHREAWGKFIDAAKAHGLWSPTPSALEAACRVVSACDKATKLLSGACYAANVPPQLPEKLAEEIGRFIRERDSAKSQLDAFGGLFATKAVAIEAWLGGTRSDRVVVCRGDSGLTIATNLVTAMKSAGLLHGTGQS